MKLKVLVTVLLVASALPVATATVPAVDSTDALNAGGNAYAQETTSANESRSSSGSGSSDSASDGDSSDEKRDYTKLYIESDHENPELKPGETGTFNITVRNGEDSAVTVNPHLFVSPVGDEQRIEKSWVTIEGDTRIESGAERTFTVTVAVPDDAKTGYYGGQIAFTNETVTYPGRPARPVHAEHVNVEVWQQPTVRIVSGNYIRSQVEAGDSVTRQIVIENTGDEAVPVNPKLESERRRRHGGRSSKFDSSWVDIDAPNRIGAGETATVTVTVSPPENTKNGRYRGELDLGLKDPTRSDDRSHWQRISMNFEVWNQPEEAFETSFRVSEDTRNVSLTLSPQSRHYARSGSDKRTDFDVVFVSPSGERFDADRVRLTDRGFVDLSADAREGAARTQGEYSVRGASQEFVYRVDDPEAGQWTVEILPENAMRFEYEIVRNEATNSTASSDSTATNSTA